MGKSVDNKSYDMVIPCYNPWEKEKALDDLTKFKDYDIRYFILDMYKTDMDFINKAHKIVGNKLRIKPSFAQEEKRTDTRDFPIYSYRKMVKAERLIDSYVKCVADQLDKDGDIKSLSPLEKFIAAYIMVIKFAEYKVEKNKRKSQNKYHVSRSVYEIIDKEFPDIVCVGFVNLLKLFLDRMGLKNTYTVTFTFLDDPNEFGGYNGHVRMLIHLIDPKYGIDGFYISDPTFDSFTLIHSTFSHMLMSHEDVKETDPKGIYDMNIGFTTVGHNATSKWEIGPYFEEFNNDDLFHKPIKPETIVKAYLAVDHFLDKNLKMTDEYSPLEFFEAACKLKLEYSLKEFDKNTLYDEILKSNIYDIYEYYPHSFTFIRETFSEDLRKKYHKNYVLLDNKHMLYVSLLSAGYHPNYNDKEYNDWVRDNCNLPVIYKFDDRPVGDQLDEMYELIEEYEKHVFSGDDIKNNSK
jgi:hypothetical protein